MRISLISLFLFISCSNFNSSNKTVQISDGVYLQNDWIYDLKKTKKSSSEISFYTIGKASSTKFKANSYFDGEVQVEHGVIIHFKYEKTGEFKNQFIGAYIQSSSSNIDEFKFPACLNVCPIKIEFDQNEKLIELKSSYSVNNSFTMELKDDVLYDLLEKRKFFRMRIPISINNMNTVFEFFEFDFSDFSKKLNN